MGRSGSAPLITTLSTVKSSPKWSFKGRFDSKTQANAAPGPGAYGAPSDPRQTAKPAFSFGSTSRDGYHGIGNPGPGQYTPVDPNHCTPKFGFGTSGRGGLARRSTTPGPGTYDAAPGNVGPRFTAAGRRSGESKAPPAPGPGAYKPIFGAANDMPLSNQARVPEVFNEAASRREGSRHEDAGPWSPRRRLHAVRVAMVIRSHVARLGQNRRAYALG
jgi:hypothetical protein